MKKIFTFNNVLAFLAMVILPLLAVPCFYVSGDRGITPTQENSINFYQRIFGFTLYDANKELIPGTGANMTVGFNPGLFLVFLFLILGILFLLAYNCVKQGSLKVIIKVLGSSFLLASGIMMCCALPLASYVDQVNTWIFELTGATIAFGVIIIVIGAFSLISLLFKKPQPKTVEEI